MERIAIIGARPAGLCCARHFQSGYQITVFERREALGGTWVYSRNTGTIYKNLVANIPKEIMNFPGHPFPPYTPTYVGSSEVLKYIHSYFGRFNLQKHIRFGHEVVSVDPIPESHSTKLSTICSSRWKVCSQDLSTGEMTVEEYDAVLVCNGHFTKPYMPSDKIAGIKFFTGTIIHSSSYREPEAFSGQDVLVIGAGYSGTDIALDLAPHTNKVYLCNRGDPIVCPLPFNVSEVPAMSEVMENGKILFSNGEDLEIHVIMMATGYCYLFPFIRGRS